MTVNLHLHGESLQCDPRTGKVEEEEKQERRESRQQKLLSWMLPLWSLAQDLVSPPEMQIAGAPLEILVGERMGTGQSSDRPGSAAVHAL